MHQGYCGRQNLEPSSQGALNGVLPPGGSADTSMHRLRELSVLSPSLTFELFPTLRLP